MSAVITIDIRSVNDLATAERATVEHLMAGRRVVVIISRDGARTLGLHAVPSGDEVLTCRGDNAMRSRHAHPAAAVAPAFREMRDVFAGFSPRRRA